MSDMKIEDLYNTVWTCPNCGKGVIITVVDPEHIALFAVLQSIYVDDIQPKFCPCCGIEVKTGKNWKEVADGYRRQIGGMQASNNRKNQKIREQKKEISRLNFQLGVLKEET